MEVYIKQHRCLLLSPGDWWEEICAIYWPGRNRADSPSSVSKKGENAARRLAGEKWPVANQRGYGWGGIWSVEFRATHTDVQSNTRRVICTCIAWRRHTRTQTHTDTHTGRHSINKANKQDYYVFTHLICSSSLSSTHRETGRQTDTHTHTHTDQTHKYVQQTHRAQKSVYNSVLDCSFLDK